MGDIFRSNWIVAKKTGPDLRKEGVAVTAQSRSNLDFQSFSKFSYPTYCTSLCFELGAESFFVFSGLENPCFLNLENTIPIVAPMPPIKTNLSSSRKFLRATSEFDYTFICFIFDIIITCMPHWRPAISCGLGHHLRLPGVRISSCWHITFFTTKSLKSLFDSCEALLMAVSYIWPLQTKPTSNSQLQFLTELLE